MQSARPIIITNFTGVISLSRFIFFFIEYFSSSEHIIEIDKGKKRKLQLLIEGNERQCRVQESVS